MTNELNTYKNKVSWGNQTKSAVGWQDEFWVMAIVIERSNSLTKSWFELSGANRGMDGV